MASRGTQRWQAIENLIAAIERVRHHGVPELVVTQKAQVPQLDPLRPTREVDVLVQVVIGGRTIRIGLDVKDEQRPLDIVMLEQLCGKREKLALDRYVVASTSGFTKEARLDAARAGIETLDLEILEQSQWLATEVMTIEATRLCIQTVSFDTLPETIEPDALSIELIDGTRVGGREEVEKNALMAWKTNYRTIDPIADLKTVFVNLDYAEDVRSQWKSFYSRDVPFGVPRLAKIVASAAKETSEVPMLRFRTSDDVETYLAQASFDGVLHHITLVVTTTGTSPHFTKHLSWSCGLAKPGKNDKTDPEVWFATEFGEGEQRVFEVGYRSPRLKCACAFAGRDLP